MLKKSKKSTEGKKLKESVSASKTRIKKLPLSGLKDWAEAKLGRGQTWARSSSRKTKIGVLCVALLAVGGGGLSLVGLDKPLTQVSTLVKSEEPSKVVSSQAAEIQHARAPKGDREAARKMKAPEGKWANTSSLDARPKVQARKVGKDSLKIKKAEKQKLSKKLDKKKNKQAKLTAKEKSKNKGKSKAIKGKSLAAKDK